MQSLAEVNVPLTGCEGFPAEGAAGFVLVICIFLSRILLNLQKQNFLVTVFQTATHYLDVLLEIHSLHQWFHVALVVLLQRGQY